MIEMGYRIVHEEPDRSEIPADLSAVIGTCLEKDPDTRPGLPTVLSLLAELSTPAEPGQPWLPEELTELIDRRTTGATLADTVGEKAGQQATETQKRAQPKKTRALPPKPRNEVSGPPLDSEPEDLGGAALEFGNLSSSPLGVVIDDVPTTRVPAGQHHRFPLSPGEHTFYVSGQEGTSALRRITLKPDTTVRQAFDGHTRPDPVEEVVFTGPREWRRGAVYAVAAAVLGMAIAFAMDTDSARSGWFMITGSAISVIALWTYVADSPSLTLREDRLQFNTDSANHSIAWKNLTQVSLVGTDGSARLVVWPPPKSPVAKDHFQGGRALTSAKAIGVADPAELARLRAALAWFAGDVWVDQPR